MQRNVVTERKTDKKNIGRREFLRSAASGACAVGLAAFAGKCALAASSQTSLEGARKGLVKPRKGDWYEPLEKRKLRCGLCPRECVLSPGERSPCRVRENRDGSLYTLAYANPALIQEDPIERKPFFHVLPGSRALSVSTAGCNLECKFCEVWDMALAAPEEVYSYEVPPEKVVGYALKSKLRSVSYAFGEPVVFYEYMKETASLAAGEGLLNLIHTAGYINPGPLEELSGFLDAANVDLKGFDGDFYRDVAGGELDPVLDTLRTLKRKGVHLEITNILIPSLNDSRDDIRKMCDWIASELGPDVPLHFARFYPLYRLSRLPRTPVSALDEARETARKSGLKYVYVSRVTGHEGENTFCPSCGEKIINRIGFVVDSVKISDGKCARCGEGIPGIWG